MDLFREYSSKRGSASRKVKKKVYLHCYVLDGTNVPVSMSPTQWLIKSAGFWYGFTQFYLRRIYSDENQMRMSTYLFIKYKQIKNVLNLLFLNNPVQITISRSVNCHFYLPPPQLVNRHSNLNSYNETFK